MINFRPLYRSCSFDTSEMKPPLYNQGFDLSCSRNDDVCKTLYPGSGGNGLSLASALGGVDEKLKGGRKKVDLVCKSVREALTAAGENKYLLSIITSFVRMSSPQLETVLSMIQKLKGSPLSLSLPLSSLIWLPQCRDAGKPWGINQARGNRHCGRSFEVFSLLGGREQDVQSSLGHVRPPSGRHGGGEVTDGP